MAAAGIRPRCQLSADAQLYDIPAERRLYLLRMKLRVGQFNLLCPAYGVKWGNREACADWVSKTEHGGSNWDQRWPALLRIIRSAPWDVLALEELEDSTRSSVESSLNALGLQLSWFPHPGRRDALGVAFDKSKFSISSSASRDFPSDNPKAATGRLDLCHISSDMRVRCVVTHQRGGNATQLQDLIDFASEPDSSGEKTDGVTLVCGDFNEDFRAAGPPPGFSVLARGPDEPAMSRPPHMQDPSQNKSGKGLIDYVFVKGIGEVSVQLERDDTSRKVVAMSHAPCAETGHWPSDHGMEALSVLVEPRSSTAPEREQPHTQSQEKEKEKEKEKDMDARQKADALKVWDYHHMHHALDGEDWDGVLCLCSSDLRVAAHAVAVHRQIRAWRAVAPGGSGGDGGGSTRRKWLCFSGGMGTGPHSGANLLGWEDAEARVFAAEAARIAGGADPAAGGLDPADVLVEPRAANTGENVALSRALLEERGLAHSRVVIVQKPFMERRSYATVRKIWPGLAAVAISSPPLSFDEYMAGSCVSRDTVISIMVGDLQRIRLYGGCDPGRAFQIPQPIPEDIWRAYERLVADGYVMNVIDTKKSLEWDDTWLSASEL